MDYWELNRSQKGKLVSLMDRQLWCWGQNIQHAAGNLLLEYGFTRIRPPEGQKACSQYSLNTGDEAVLRLWGYGLAYLTATDGCFFSRAAFSPALFKSKIASAIFSSEDLPPLKYTLSVAEKQRCSGYLESVLCEIASYESWLEDRMGSGYREEILSHRKHGIARHRESVLERAELIGNESPREALAV